MLTGRSDVPPDFDPTKPKKSDHPSMAALASALLPRRKDNLPPSIVLPDKIVPPHRTHSGRPVRRHARLPARSLVSGDGALPSQPLRAPIPATSFITSAAPRPTTHSPSALRIFPCRRASRWTACSTAYRCATLWKRRQKTLQPSQAIPLLTPTAKPPSPCSATARSTMPSASTKCRPKSWTVTAGTASAGPCSWRGGSSKAA